MSWSIGGQGKAARVRQDILSGADSRRTHLRGVEGELHNLAMLQIDQALALLPSDYPVTVNASGSASWKDAAGVEQINTLKVEITPFHGWDR